jgi:hypothetical protein
MIQDSKCVFITQKLYKPARTHERVAEIFTYFGTQKNKNNVTRIEFSITNYPLNIRKKNPGNRDEETKGYKVN